MNHLLSAIMPAHAALAYHAETASPVKGPRGKYIVVNRLGMDLAILFHESINHSDAINRNDAQPLDQL